MKDLALFVPPTLADHQRGLAVSQEAITDLEGRDLGGAEAGGEEGVEERPGPDGTDGAPIAGPDGICFGMAAQANEFLGGEVADFALGGRHGCISLHRNRTSRLLQRAGAEINARDTRSGSLVATPG
jgi:hypothetical protein